MKKIITKTIIAIVFVVFFGVQKVSAADWIASCEYPKPDSNQTIILDIYKSNSFSMYDTGAPLKVNDHNWTKSLDLLKTGYEIYSETGKCPPKILYAPISSSTLDIYFCEKKTLEKCKSVFETKINNRYLVLDLDRESYRDDSTPVEEEEEEEEKHYDDPEVDDDIVTPFEADTVTYSCGDRQLTGIPKKIPKIGKIVYNFLNIIIPIVVIILGSIDLLKAIVGNKEDEIKKGQQIFIKRLIAAVVVFFAFAIVKLLISIVNPDSSNIISCIDCIIRDSNNCVRENV